MHRIRTVATFVSLSAILVCVAACSQKPKDTPAVPAENPADDKAKSPAPVVVDKPADPAPKAVAKETLADALSKGKWTLEIDLAPRFGGKANAAYHDRPGTVSKLTVKEGKVTGEYSYKPALGEVKASFEGEIKDEDSFEVTFTEKGFIASKGVGKFKVERDPKTGKVTALNGYWKLIPIDPELKWLIKRADDKR